jgi:plasmid stabilization system protein ParE
MSELIISTQAQDDLYSYIDTIYYEYDSPQTAKRHLDGIYEVLHKIQKNPEAYPVRFEQSLMQYGQFPRRVNYKKMAIIYIINGSTVYIRRIVAASLITSL